ncbi:hypothetical protein LZK98_11655 [Sphingomonas cannabina]|uniref:hypothetical protein n=1 Tax=Sphingomonas cannabina TaxID=2899123 RepID=UPI001F20BA33|nr:hypothetical protein [Sphingomonas cannabina]UIJ43746.1 hypothetical protein LZK98_11655 [Sphingomonas cannabina]
MPETVAVERRLSPEKLDDLERHASRDDWHMLIVGPDIRQLIAELREERAALQSSAEQVRVLREALNEAALAIETLMQADDLIEWAEPIRRSKRGQEDDDEFRKERKSAIYQLLDDAQQRARATLKDTM